MRRSTRHIMLQSRALGLSMPQLGVLIHIHRKRVCSVSDIGEDLGTSRAAASQMVDRLVHMGFVERSEDPNDRRAKRIALSDQGMRTLKQSMHGQLDWLNQVSRSLTAQEREQVGAALKLLTARTYELDPSYRSEKRDHPAPIWNGDWHAGHSHDPELRHTHDNDSPFSGADSLRIEDNDSRVGDN
jgi:DNA-binding MarR family transcriptional regulator